MISGMPALPGAQGGYQDVPLGQPITLQNRMLRALTPALLRTLGRESEAEHTLRAGIEKAPRDAMLHHALGLSLVRQKRGAEALGELKLATQLAPQNQRFAYVYEVARKELAGSR